MNNETSMVSTFLRALAQIVGRATFALFAFLVPMICLSMIANGLRNGSEWLGTHASPVYALIFVIVCGSAWLALLMRITPEMLRNDAGRIEPGFAVGFITAAATLWVYIFAVLSWVLVKTGALTYVFKNGEGNQLSDLLDSYLWNLLDLVPALHVNQALGWESDVELSGGWRGCILLLFRLLIIYQVFAFARKLFKAGSEAPPRPA